MIFPAITAADWSHNCSVAQQTPSQAVDKILEAHGGARVLIDAIVEVESAGNWYAVGKAGELGGLQITEILVRDVNRILGSDLFSHPDALDPVKARAMFRIYVNLYATAERIGRAPTIQDVVRIWNGGPSGWKKSATFAYWQRVQSVMFRMLRDKLLAAGSLAGKRSAGDRRATEPNAQAEASGESFTRGSVTQLVPAFTGAADNRPVRWNPAAARPDLLNREPSV